MARKLFCEIQPGCNALALRSERVVGRKWLDEWREQLAGLLRGEDIDRVDRDELADRVVVFPHILTDQSAPVVVRPNHVRGSLRQIGSVGVDGRAAASEYGSGSLLVNRRRGPHRSLRGGIPVQTGAAAPCHGHPPGL